MSDQGEVNSPEVIDEDDIIFQVNNVVKKISSFWSNKIVPEYSFMKNSFMLALHCHLPSMVV